MAKQTQAYSGVCPVCGAQTKRDGELCRECREAEHRAEQIRRDEARARAFGLGAVKW